MKIIEIDGKTIRESKMEDITELVMRKLREGENAKRQRHREG